MTNSYQCAVCLTNFGTTLPKENIQLISSSATALTAQSVSNCPSCGANSDGFIVTQV
jgi:rubredoxin